MTPSLPSGDVARVTLTAPSHVVENVRCASCHREVDLECEGLPGFWGYPTYHEFFCPHCGKQNHARTSGAVVRARAWEDEPRRSV
jgi:predicted RNA-binding Zn-ribbon protein involved in translation (DUF1610 family)